MQRKGSASRRALWCALCWAVLDASAAASLPLISEVLYDQAGSDDGHSFVELFGAPGTPLDGLWLEGVNGFDGGVGPVIALTGSIGPSGLFVVADRTGGGVTFVSVFDQLANFDLQNGPDSVRLVSDAGVLDAVGYGAFDATEVFAGEGVAAPDAPGGASLARVFADVDTDDNAADFTVQVTPTPGSAPLRVAVPEPAMTLLMSFGLVLWWWYESR
jgi:hypothetical protein